MQNPRFTRVCRGGEKRGNVELFYAGFAEYIKHVNFIGFY